MKASKFQSFIIMLRSIWTLLTASLATIFTAMTKKNDRAAIDHIFRKLSKNLLNIVKLDYKIYIHHPLNFAKERHYIVMTNHASHYDIPLSALAIPGSLRMITKKELFNVPIWGRAMKAAEFISIDRNDRKQAQKDLEIAKEKMKKGIIIWIAPEGTRSKTGDLLPFKKGGFMLAFQMQAIIIPMGIRNSDKILPAKTSEFNLNETAEVHIGKPIDVSQYKIKERQKLMDDVEASIRELANKPKKSEAES